MARAEQVTVVDTGLGWAARYALTTSPRSEEVTVVADESAVFARWSAATNVDEHVLDQLDAEVADLVERFLVAPPGVVFGGLVQGRDTLFELIVNGRQPPRPAMRLYGAAGQVCAMLAHASADLGIAHAAMTQSRVALRCAQHAEAPALAGYIAWVRSNLLYWNEQYDQAADLVGAALRAAPAEGTTRMRLASQLARVEARRGRADAVRGALVIADRNRGQATPWGSLPPRPTGPCR